MNVCLGDTLTLMLSYALKQAQKTITLALYETKRFSA